MDEQEKQLYAEALFKVFPEPRALVIEPKIVNLLLAPYHCQIQGIPLLPRKKRGQNKYCRRIWPIEMVYCPESGRSLRELVGHVSCDDVSLWEKTTVGNWLDIASRLRGHPIEIGEKDLLVQIGIATVEQK
jgi:hypothetical protein